MIAIDVTQAQAMGELLQVAGRGDGVENPWLVRMPPVCRPGPAEAAGADADNLRPAVAVDIGESGGFVADCGEDPMARPG